MPTITYLFETPGNYIYADDITVDSDVAALSLVDNAAQNFTQQFTSDVGFMYNPDTAVFSGTLVEQIPTTEATCGAAYSLDANLADWSIGNTIGTLIGNAAVVGGSLDLTHDDLSYVSYSGANNVSSAIQTGAVRIDWTPNYTGTPTSNQTLFHMGEGETNVNNVTLLHGSSGDGSLTITDATGAPIVNTALGQFNPTAGVTYEIELNWDVTAGETRIFVDGQIFGGVIAGTGTRAGTASVLLVGTNSVKSSTANCAFSNFMVFDTVQHTGGYIPEPTFPVYRYLETGIVLPAQVYSGLGGVRSFDSFLDTATSEAKYNLNGLFHNGSGWVVSDGTYAEMNSAVECNTYIDELPGQDTLLITAALPDGNVIQSITTVSLDYTGQLYSQLNPKITPNASFGADGLSGVFVISEAPDSTLVNFTVTKDGTEMYWNGSAWAVSTGYAQSNTIDDLHDNIHTLITTNAVIQINTYLHTPDGLSTPQIDELSVVYDFYAPPIGDPKTCVVQGWVLDSNGHPVGGSSVTATPDFNGDLDPLNYWITKQPISIQTDSVGYFELELIQSSQFEVETTYTFSIVRAGDTKQYKKYNVLVPDLPSIDYNDL